MTGLHPATRVVNLSRPEHVPGQPVSPPIELSSSFVADPRATRVGYGRSDNRTWEGLEAAIADLEGASRCVAFASGMAAISAVLDQLASGGLLVMPASVYNTTAELAGLLHERGRVTLRTLDKMEPGPLARALAGAEPAPGSEPTAMVWLESPTNPLLTVLDLAGCAELARAAGAWTVVDNTFATPLLQQPLSLGADVVVHSVTKYLSGHSDLLLGAAAVARPEVGELLIRHRRVHGAIPGPMECWLALRGLRTLDVRLERSQANAAELARRAAAHPAVRRVRYPGLPSDPGHRLAAKMMRGFGAVFSIEVAEPSRDGSEEELIGADADTVIEALRLWTPATSLGGVESLAERRRRHENEPTVVPVNLIRLATGIEHVEDLWADLRAALDTLLG